MEEGKKLKSKTEKVDAGVETLKCDLRPERDATRLSEFEHLPLEPPHDVHALALFQIYSTDCCKQMPGCLHFEQDLHIHTDAKLNPGTLLPDQCTSLGPRTANLLEASPLFLIPPIGQDNTSRHHHSAMSTREL
jgi:hypothetical protein